MRAPPHLSAEDIPRGHYTRADARWHVADRTQSCRRQQITIGYTLRAGVAATAETALNSAAIESREIPRVTNTSLDA